MENLEEVEEAGRLAREAFLAHFDFPLAFARFSAALGVHRGGAEDTEKVVGLRV